MRPPSDLDVERTGFYLRPDYFELLAWLRAHDPVHRSANGMWLVSRYDDIREISRDPARFTSRRDRSRWATSSKVDSIFQTPHHLNASCKGCQLASSLTIDPAGIGLVPLA